MYFDFDYFSGKDLHYPNKPRKPTLGRNPDSVEAMAWAEAMVEYERELKSYKEDRDYYSDTINRRLKELQKKLQDDYDITDTQFSILWNRAWEEGHSEGLYRVVGIFDELYDIASEFAALEKN